VKALGGVLLLLVLAHAAAFVSTEPYYNNDETRHVMTGVFVRDLLLDRPSPGKLRGYAETYYLQYPALGLLVWPPAFYVFEGLLFLVLGDGYLVARLLVGLFTVLACVYLFLLVRRTHGRGTAFLATLIFGLSPQVFVFSDRVMLEMPALSWTLMTAYHFHRFLEEQSKRDLFLCCAAMALTALTRFDAVFLAPLLLLWLVAARRLALLKRPAVWVGLACAAVVVAPVWCLTVREFGSAHAQTATSSPVLAPESLLYYPARLSRQMGWAALLPMAVGFLRAISKERRALSCPYLALFAAVAVTFTLIAEKQERHVIYWTPALAVFVADGCLTIGQFLVRHRHPPPSRIATMIVAALVIAGMAVQSWRESRNYVRGYEEAAEYVVANNNATPVCLFDGFLNGGFIYHVRRHDPQRRLWVLRGDKLLYAVLTEPIIAQEQFATDQAKVLELLFQFDPELIVVEEPLVYHRYEDTPGAQLLRQTLKDHPERFERVKVIPIDSNHVSFRGHELHVYRSLRRNPNREDIREIKVLGLGRAVRPGDKR